MFAASCIALLVSCRKEDTTTYLDMDFRCSQSDQTPYKNISFELEKVVLHKNDGSTQNLANSGKDIFFSIENPEPIRVNSWELDPMYVKDIELMISEMTVKKDSVYMTCKIPENWKCIYKDVNTNMEVSSAYWISLGLDLRNTVILDSANEYWIKPVFTGGLLL